MRDERLVVRIVDLDRDKLHVLDPLREQIERAPVGRVIALHVGDLDDAAGPIRAAAIRSQPVSVSASGFSHITCSPASSAAYRRGWNGSGFRR